MQETQERPPLFGTGLPSKGRVADIPQPVKELKGALRGLLGNLLRDTLDRYEAVIMSDRQFEIVKKLTMNSFGDSERAMSAIVSRLLLAEPERSNGNGKPADADNRTLGSGR